MMLQNVNEVNREHTRIKAVSSFHDPTRQNGLYPSGIPRSEPSSCEAPGQPTINDNSFTAILRPVLTGLVLQ